MTKALICYMLSIVCLIIATMISTYLIFDFHNIYWWGIGLLLALIFLSITGIANTCWFKYLEELQKENQELKKEIEDIDNKLKELGYYD